MRALTLIPQTDTSRINTLGIRPYKMIEMFDDAQQGVLISDSRDLLEYVVTGLDFARPGADIALVDVLVDMNEIIATREIQDTQSDDPNKTLHLWVVGSIKPGGHRALGIIHVPEEGGN